MMVDGKGGLPPGIADRLSFQTGGSKVARQEEEALILWGLVKECYPSEEAAVTAVNKNSLILNPSMNSSAPSDRISGTCLPPFYAWAPVRRGRPSKITGTFELLVERFGAEVATEIITKNPGILSCVAASVAKQSNEEILKATDFADGLVENKEAVKLAIFAAAFALFNLVGWRIISTNPKIGAFFNL
jgi:hypothetical protein